MILLAGLLRILMTCISVLSSELPLRLGGIVSVVMKIIDHNYEILY
jgi:hypothetical protein